MRSYYVEGETLPGLRNALHWIKSDAPRKKERNAASNLLFRLEGVEDDKQLFVSSTEFDILEFIYKDIPDVLEHGKQLKLIDVPQRPVRDKKGPLPEIRSQQVVRPDEKKLIFFSKDKKDGVLEVLSWIIQDAPSEKDREAAKRLKKKVEAVEGITQLALSRREMELLNFIYREIPEALQLNQQMGLFKPATFSTSSYEKPAPPTTFRVEVYSKDGRVLGSEDIPVGTYKGEEKPKLKKYLTSQEQDEREAAGLPRLGTGQYPAVEE